MSAMSLLSSFMSHPSNGQAYGSYVALWKALEYPVCHCGEPLTMEYERDLGTCCECQREAYKEVDPIQQSMDLALKVVMGVAV